MYTISSKCIYLCMLKYCIMMQEGKTNHLWFIVEMAYSFASLHSKLVSCKWPFSQDAVLIGSSLFWNCAILCFVLEQTPLDWIGLYMCFLRALPSMMQWIRSQRPGESGVNIITADFVELGEFISAVITLNYYLDDEEENATWTSTSPTSLVVSITCSLSLCHIFMFYWFL